MKQSRLEDINNELRVPRHIQERRNKIQKVMVQCGEMARLEQHLRKKLISVGWKQELKNYCKELIRQKGIEKVTVQYLMEELQKRGKHSVPIAIKQDLLSRVRHFLQEHDQI